MVLRGRMAPQLVRKLWVAYFFSCLVNWVTVFSKCLASVLWLARPPLSCPTAQKVCFCRVKCRGAHPQLGLLKSLKNKSPLCSEQVWGSFLLEFDRKNVVIV